ncbi:DEAD/DEAH box helicase [Ignatzschineria indica]|uniref:DEAD/DEAH box helicase n=1 Tax=Ignatzschineria indica TaxID=472583 RepID=UPI002577BDD2|nr:DEAD/DEAH box helicase [Ignatzschineria indica]MDM1546223.1 DEAD/DEAH box helicase [Ignatzschineria indica]
MDISLRDAVQHSFLNLETPALDHLKTKLLTNSDYETQLLPSIIDHLKSASSFDIAVAFITKGGLSMLKSILHDLAIKGVEGRLLTSNYLNFNDPAVFDDLLKIPNLKVRISSKPGFHAKGYFFHYNSYSTAIIGSSNLTANALKTNYEWNLLFSHYKESQLYRSLHHSFEAEWSNSIDLTHDFIEDYRANQRPNDLTNRSIVTQSDIKIVPNSMQIEALKALQNLRDQNQSRAIIVSATGSGKTYLSAFDVKTQNPKRFLFLAHREQILQKSLKSYEKIIPNDAKTQYGVYSGNQKDIDANYLFATVQTLSQDNHLTQFQKNYFDYIVIDEVHRSGADSYQKIINYFTPKFLLGMTATPERTDGYNIYELFDYNLAYEIRLQDALKMEIIAPFHYFGVTDYIVDGQVIDDITTLKYLVHDERVNFLIEKINYYGYSGDRPKGLIFCRSVEEAQALSAAFNKRGYRTTALSGTNTQIERLQATKALEAGELQYIFVVDIFNEGIDIASLNQVIMLRQTESSIIFLQQLGRGLRKYKNKEYLVVIDFIGNYKNNFLIPIALTGDNSLNKESIRKNVIDPGFLHGITTINFEKIAEESIINSLNKTPLDSVQNIKKAYLDLKNRIGKIPKFIDFIKYNSIDPLVIINKYNSYDQFILKMEQHSEATLSPYIIGVLQFLTKELSSGKRLQEIILLENLLEMSNVSKKEFEQSLIKNNLLHDTDTIKSVENFLSYEFLVSKDKEKYGIEGPINITKESYSFNEFIYKELKKETHLITRIQDIIDVAKEKSRDYNSHRPLTPFKRYSRKDACWLLNWKKDEKGTIYGYRLKHNTLPIFITYEKDAELNSDVHYADEILNPDTIKWYSKSNQTTESKEIREILASQENKTAKIHVFIKKNDSEGSDFYYLGVAKIDFETIKDERVLNHSGEKEYNIVSMNLILERSIELSLYHYLMS